MHWEARQVSVSTDVWAMCLAGKTPLDVADNPFSENAEQMKALLRAYHVFDLGPSFDTGGEDNFLI
eukprot:1195118-Prorocentrum_minimum.AAC.1